MRIADFEIAHDAPTFIIAELSANHGHSLDVALRTIDAAADVGANAIKIQTYTPDTLTLRIDTEPFIVRSNNVWSGRTLYDLYADAMTPWEWTSALRERARLRDLAFFSTPFDVSAVDFLMSQDVDAMKVASFELGDLPLVEHIARQGLPMILSTGMATLGEIRRAVQACRDAGNPNIALLRCVSTYPATPQDMQLESIATLAALGVHVGLSDHTRDNTAAATAVALGARIVEKHFILDRNVGGPDAFFSLEPAEFRALVETVRATERALGVRFGPTESEQSSLVFRRSLFVSADIRKGDTFTCDNVRSVRPGHGMAPRMLPEVLGRTSTRELRAGTALQPEHITSEPDVIELAVVPNTRGALEAWTAVYGPSMPDPISLVVEGEEMLGAFTLSAAGRLEIAMSPSALGRPVLSAIERYARSLGLLTLFVSATNEAAEDTLKRLGFYHFRATAHGTTCERRIAPYLECK